MSNLERKRAAKAEAKAEAERRQKQLFEAQDQALDVQNNLFAGKELLDPARPRPELNADATE